MDAKEGERVSKPLRCPICFVEFDEPGRPSTERLRRECTHCGVTQHISWRTCLYDFRTWGNSVMVLAEKDNEIRILEVRTPQQEAQCE